MPLPVLHDEGYGRVVPEDDKPDLPPGLQDDAVSGTDPNHSIQNLLGGCFVSFQIEKLLSLFFLLVVVFVMLSGISGTWKRSDFKKMVNNGFLLQSSN